MPTYRLNLSCKFIQPPNPEANGDHALPPAEDFWSWTDKAVANTKKMIEFDTVDRQVFVPVSVSGDVSGAGHGNVAGAVSGAVPGDVSLFGDVSGAGHGAGSVWGAGFVTGHGDVSGMAWECVWGWGWGWGCV